MRIWIRKADIQLGSRGRNAWCPIALCLKRRFPGSTVNVGTGVVFLNDDLYRHSDGSADFVSKFDQGSPVQPQYVILQKEKQF